MDRIAARALPGLLVLSVPLFCGSALASDCEFIAKVGAEVSSQNGECTLPGHQEGAPKKGVERCTKDGKLITEFTWKAGQRTGSGFYHDYNDNKLVFTFQNDKANGPARVYDRNGKLLCEIDYVDNHAAGVVKEYHPSGKLRGAYLFKDGEPTGKKIELREDGKVSSLKCADRSLVPEDRGPCGFAGQPATVKLDGSSVTETRDQGKLRERRFRDENGRQVVRTYPKDGSESDYDATISYPSGKPYRVYGVRGQRRQGPFKEYAEGGQLVEDSVYKDDKAVAEKTFYLNGNVKKIVALSADGKWVAVQEFWDTGKLRLKGSFTEEKYYTGYGVSGWHYLSPQGQVLEYYEDGTQAEEANYKDGQREGRQRSFHKNGKLAEDSVYHGDKLASLKRYDDKGNLELDEEYFEDGSRKLKRR